MKRSVLALFAAAAVLGGCATAGTDPTPGDDDDDDVPVIDGSLPGTPDASQVPGTPDASQAPGTPDATPPGPPDARPPVDAYEPPIDAPPPPPPDAGLFCTNDSMCPMGQCCLTLGGPMGFCVPGVSIPGLGCIPSE